MKTHSKNDIPGRRRVRRIVALGIGACLLAALLAVVVVKAWADRHFYDGYIPGAPVKVRVRSREERDVAVRYVFDFDGVRGMRVPAVLYVPREATPDRPAPCVIFLHGIGQKKEFLDRIASYFLDAGFAVGTFDQYTRGERRLPKDASLWEQAVAFRRRAALTVLETRRFVDVLCDRPDVAADRVYLVGASYGAITGATAAAMDSRLRAAVLCYGGGNLRRLFCSREVKKVLGWKAVPASWLVAWWLSPADPLRYVRRVAPRPILLQNGLHDGLIPVAAAHALFLAAAQPKTQTWYDSDHVGLDKHHTLLVLHEAIAWLQNTDSRDARGAVPGVRWNYQRVARPGRESKRLMRPVGVPPRRASGEEGARP